ncbi:MAG TPA: protein kinase, partial [Sandaracinaceae bacterium]
GKFAYMAPEQMVGARVDRRADVWSLGVVLFELLAGRPLFKRKTETETVMAVSRLERPSLSELRPGLCPGLAAIVERALERDPDARYPTARALADDLAAWLDAQPGPGDHAEVAAWMRRLFPSEEEHEDAEVRRALARALPARATTSGHEASAVVRRDGARPPRKLAVALYLLALALAVAAGALAALPQWAGGL